MPKTKKKKKKGKIKFDEVSVRTDYAPEEAPEFLAYVVVPPDGGWGWVVVVAAFLSNLIIDGTVYSSGMFLDELSDSFNVNKTRVTIASSILTAVYFITGPLICAMANRCGFRLVGLVGGIIGTVSFLAVSFADNIILYTILYGGLVGMSFSMCFIANILAVGFYFDRLRPVAIALAVTGSGVGTVVLPIVINRFLSDADWRYKYKILSACLGVVALLALVLKPINPVLITTDDKTASKMDEAQSMMSVSVAEDNPKSIFYRRHNSSFPTHSSFAVKNDILVHVPTTIKPIDTRDIPSTATASRSSFKSYRTYNPRQSITSFKSYTTFKSDRLFMSDNFKRNRCRYCCACCCIRCMYYQHAPQRPMYKDDILYTGSVYTIGPYDREKAKAAKSVGTLDFHMSVTRVATAKDLREHNQCCICCPEAVRRTLATMFDFSLLKSGAFSLLILSGFLTYIGLYTPYTYIVEFGRSQNMTNSEATMLLSAIGCSNTVGRLLIGCLAMVPNMKAMLLTEIALLTGGIAIGIIGFFKSTIAFYVCVSIFGFSIASIASLRPIIAVDMVGLENLTNAFGLVVLFQGFSCSIGLPLGSKLYEITGDLAWSFIYAGTAILISALVLFPIPAMLKREKKLAETKENLNRERIQKYTKEKLEAVNQPTSTKRK